MKNLDKIVVVDVETSGLEPGKHVIRAHAKASGKQPLNATLEIMKNPKVTDNGRVWLMAAVAEILEEA